MAEQLAKLLRWETEPLYSIGLIGQALIISGVHLLKYFGSRM